MARVTLGTGESITIGGTTEIFGTSGSQSVTILDGSSVTFRSGFNTGGDTIRLNGAADDFVMSRSGSNVTLFSAADGITIVIPIGTVANTIIFDNGDSRSLSIVDGVPTLGDQAIPTDAPIALTAGPGSYEVVANSEGTEGDTVTFTVTRTDTTSAETLQYTVQGDTNGGSVPAATAGADFTAAGNSVTFAAGVATATFTVALNTDNNVEGIEGYSVQLFDGSEVVASTAALILDANNVGQTFQLTSGIDSVGTGSAQDLIGSEGSTNTDGQDTIIATNGSVSLLNPNLGLAGDLGTFDNINGGLEQDTLIVLDNGSPFTSAPNFTGVTITNVEMLQYAAPTRGFNGNALNTVSFTGLEMVTASVNSGQDQTVTLASTTSATLTQAGNGDVTVNGGGGVLTVNTVLGGASDVTVGATTAPNAWTTVNISGGDDIAITDRGAQTLTTVNLVGTNDEIAIIGSAVATVNVSGLTTNNGRAIQIDATNTTLNLTNVAAGSENVDVFSDGIITVVASNVTGLDDVRTNSSSATVTNAGPGSLALDDISVMGGNGTVNLNATGGSITLGNIDSASGGGGDTYPTRGDANDVRSVNITGSSRVTMQSVEQSSTPAGTVITSTSSGGVTINTQLSNNTQFAGADSSGNDIVGFGATVRDNDMGAGNDSVALNVAALGTGGSIDGGADFDNLTMDVNDAASFTAGAPTSTFNFEQITLTTDGNTVNQHDIINLGNIGFTTTSDVVSNVGDGAETEVTTITFVGVASSTDSVTFDGVTVNFVDMDDAADLAAAFVAQYGVGPNWTATPGVNPGEVVLTANTPGSVDDLKAADFVFDDAQTLGSVGLEQIGGNPATLDDGNAPVDGIIEVRTLNLDFVSVLTGQTITITEDINGGFIPAADPVFTFTAPADVTHVGGELASFFVDQWNDAPGFSDRWVASVDGNNVVFTATTVGDQDPFTLFNNPTGNFTVGGTGLSGADTFSIDNATVAGADPIAGDTENASFALDGVATGNDQLIFDGSTITFQDGDGPTDLANAFAAQYNGLTWTVSGTAGSIVFLESVAEANLPNLSAADFEFVDDTNVGTPSVVVATTQQGSNTSVTLNNFISGSTLTLNAANGTHTVNMTTDTASDVLNIVLANNGPHGAVTANEAETVTINTDAFGGSLDFLDFFGTDLTTLVVTGSDGLDLNTNSTIISTIDASGLGGVFNWEADANSVNITVSTGSGGSNVDFSAMTIPGGNTTTGNAPITFLGGSGNDNIITGGDSTSRGTITTGAGFDDIFVGIVDGGNDFWSVTDFNTVLDDLIFAGTNNFVGLDQELEPTATFQDYLDQAADGDAGDIRYFYWQGDTYVVKDNTDGEDFNDGADTVIRLEGELVLTADNFG